MSMHKQISELERILLYYLAGSSYRDYIAVDAGKIDFGSSKREVRVSLGSSHRDSTVFNKRKEEIYKVGLFNLGLYKIYIFFTLIY